MITIKKHHTCDHTLGGVTLVKTRSSNTMISLFPDWRLYKEMKSQLLCLGHAQSFASHLNMNLHCITFTVFPTTNVQSSNLIVFPFFCLSIYFYQGVFDLQRITKMITKSPVSLGLGQGQSRIINVKFPSHFVQNATRGEITGMLFEMDSREFQTAALWCRTVQKNEWRNEAAGVRGGGLCDGQRAQTLENRRAQTRPLGFLKQSLEYVAL